MESQQVLKRPRHFHCQREKTSSFRPQVSTLHPSVVTEGHGRLRCPRMCHLSHQQRTHLLYPFASKSVRQISSYHNGKGEMEKLVISEG